ncbi:nucleolar protein 9 [Phymastichus coffea]|uniref:nucleolar protein 9 n=1 Tax=Phymastichus coffea TaxID=108790 RepID=UPI00273A9263|nr:nucleolar protein 9 [Phymastichus coffea]
MENQEEPRRDNKRKKKKRSSHQMAKKVARSRSYGELNAETYQYISSILEAITTEFPKIQDKDIFANNVYEQAVGKEIDFARNQVGSRVLDTLLEYTSFETIVRFAGAFDSALRPICSDRFASHVIEKLIRVCAYRGNLSKTESDKKVEVKDSEVKKYNEIALKFCKYAINNIEEFIWDTYANHILRTAIECLGGLITVQSNNKKRGSPDLSKRSKVKEEYIELLVETCNRLYQFPQFQEFNHDELTSGLMQSVLYSLKDVDSKLNSLIIKKISTDCFNPSTDNSVSNIFNTECSIRLLEVCLAVSTFQDFDDIYGRYFKNQFGKLVSMISANFCVPKVFDYCHKKECLESMFDEIAEYLEHNLSKGHKGIFASVANACVRLHAKQGPFVNLMMKILHCDEPNERQVLFVPLLSSLQTYENYQSLKNSNESKPKIEIYGSVTVQAMLKFNKPIKIVNSLLSMSTEDLLELFEDPKGSWIMDAFMDSEYIGEKSREKLARNLRGTWAKLATSTHGSRSLDKIWTWAKSNQRNIIMEDLAEVGQLLHSTNAGKIISAKLNVPLYIRNKKEWAEFQGKEQKMKALFADIVDNPKKNNS